MALFFGKKNKNETPEDRRITDVELTKITPNRFQPRHVFTDDAIDDLAQTIADHGLLQPIVVRRFDEDKFEIIAGERRFKAVQKLGWESIPAIIETMDDQRSASLALIENLQRENLNPIDEAKAYIDLMKMNEMTQTKLAESVGKTQSYVANKIRLLKLDNNVQYYLVSGQITQRHGRALLKLDAEQQNKAVEMILAEKLNVKETENLVEEMLEGPVKKVAKPRKRRNVRGRTGRDFKVPINTIKKTIQMVQDTGVRVKYNEVNEQGSYQITIELLND